MPQTRQHHLHSPLRSEGALICVMFIGTVQGLWSLATILFERFLDPQILPGLSFGGSRAETYLPFNQAKTAS